MAWGSSVASELRACSGSLNELGFAEVSTLPAWEVFDFVEEYHAKYASLVADLLDDFDPDTRMQADVNVVHAGFAGSRPGTLAATRANEELKKRDVHGVFVSATHPSQSEKTWRRTGPRFYVSLITAAMR